MLAKSAPDQKLTESLGGSLKDEEGAGSSLPG